jgi:hypothetical protein
VWSILKTKLYLDEEEIKLNDFVESILANIMDGFVSSLRLTNAEWNALELKIFKD